MVYIHLPSLTFIIHHQLVVTDRGLAGEPVRLDAWETSVARKQKNLEDRSQPLGAKGQIRGLEMVDGNGW